MSGNWTKGPWVFDGFGIYQGVEGKYGLGKPVVEAGPGHVYDEIDTDPTTLDIEPENLAIILAAPDMADTLIWLRANLRNATTSEIEHLLDAIIAKARGET